MIEQDTQHQLWPLNGCMSMSTCTLKYGQTDHTLKNIHDLKNKNSKVKDTVGNFWGVLTDSSVPFQASC